MYWEGQEPPQTGLIMLHQKARGKWVFMVEESQARAYAEELAGVAGEYGEPPPARCLPRIDADTEGPFFTASTRGIDECPK